MDIDNEDDGNTKDLNMTICDDDIMSDINSVLSGQHEDGEQEFDNDNNLEGVFGKNLGSIFDDNVNNNKPSSINNQQQRPINNNMTKSTVSNSNNSNNPSRPPLAPGRSISSSINNNSTTSSSNKSLTSNKSQQNTNNNSGDDKRLSVFLRVRPPVCSNGKKGNEGSINTIEIIGNKDNEGQQQQLPTTIRTYPPLNSNAAKVVRGTNNNSNRPTSSHSSSRSLNDDGSVNSDNGFADPNAEIKGVKEYAYSGVFGPNSTQCEVYDNVAAPLVDGLFPQMNNGEEGGVGLGESALLFTLGVTNAGKTHTVMGTGFETKKNKSNMMLNIGGDSKKNIDTSIPNKNWGIIPRALDHMLTRVNSLNESGGQKLQMYMSYLEIYNEQIYDLLPGKSDVPRRPCDGPPTLKLRESRRGRIFVRGLARNAVNNVQQGLELAQMAKNNRHTASNNINAESSRSHSICQLEITHSPIDSGCGGCKADGTDSEYETDDDSSVCSKSSAGSQRQQRKSTIIWIVDLAGSERSKRTRSHSRHQKEAALINASLMNLMRCLREMLNHQPKKRGAASKGGVVPFRESKLTHMFMNHLTGPAASRTSMIVNVNPAADDYDETQHVLGYAATARSVTISAVDYNRKRRLFAKESKVKSPKKALAKIVKKMSPKKRKGGTTNDESSSNPQAKRLRSNSHSSATTALGKKFARTATGGGGARKPPPSSQTATAGNNELEQLREENFDLKVTVDDLRQQLEDCENEVREEVVATMSEQLQDTKEWYESRIAQLNEKVNTQASSNAVSQLNVQNDNADLQERISECEEEMKRMREDHVSEVEDLNSKHLQLANEHFTAIDNLTAEHKKELRDEQMKSKQLENELGSTRHFLSELQVGHDSLLAKYNALVATTQREASFAATQKENPAAAVAGMHQPESPSFKRLPRDRVSDVASTTAVVDIASPSKGKNKIGKWFRSPGAKVGGKAKSPVGKSPIRSPLGKVNMK